LNRTFASDFEFVVVFTFLFMFAVLYYSLLSQKCGIILLKKAKAAVNDAALIVNKYFSGGKPTSASISISGCTRGLLYWWV